MSDQARGQRAVDFARVEQNGATILTIRGKLVIENSASLKSEVADLEAAGVTKVLIDLRELIYLDSSGVGALMSLFKRLGVGRNRIYFAGAKDQPAYLLKVVRFEKTLALYDTIDEAMRRFDAA
jgi:anti-sigma B factor antagonist